MNFLRPGPFPVELSSASTGAFMITRVTDLFFGVSVFIPPATATYLCSTKAGAAGDIQPVRVTVILAW